MALIGRGVECPGSARKEVKKTSGHFESLELMFVLKHAFSSMLWAGQEPNLGWNFCRLGRCVTALRKSAKTSQITVNISVVGNHLGENVSNSGVSFLRWVQKHCKSENKAL